MGIKLISLAAIALVSSTSVNAAPIEVTFEVNTLDYSVVIYPPGSGPVSANIELNFTVKNNIPGLYNQGVNKFGIDIFSQSNTPYRGYPDAPNWSQGVTTFNTLVDGGRDILFETNWLNTRATDYIKSGDSLSGFTVIVPEVPDVINFYAYTSSTIYVGDIRTLYTEGDEFYRRDLDIGGEQYTVDLGFEGVALAPVPVPAAVWLFGSGLLGLISVARRK